MFVCSRRQKKSIAIGYFSSSEYSRKKGPGRAVPCGSPRDLTGYQPLEYTMTDGQDGYRDGRDGDGRTSGTPGSAEVDGNGHVSSADPPESPAGQAGATEQRPPGQRTPRRSQRRRVRRAEGLGEPAPENLSGLKNGESARQIVGRDREEIHIDEYTTDRRSLASVVQVQWAISAAITAVILGLLTTAGLTFVNVDPRVGVLSILVYLVLAMGWVAMRYRVWVYQIREDSIYLERGVLTHVRTLVPYVRIQHVDTSRGPVERALGLSTLVVYTAGSRGADVAIPGLRPHEASDLQQRIKELAIEAEGDDAL
jgi:membrane protein YdbS with pleckstrin-like domain